MSKLGHTVCISGPIRRPWIQGELKAAGCEVVLGKSYDDFPDFRYPEEEFASLIGDSEILLVSSRDRVTGSLLGACPNLIAVVKPNIGVEKIDIQAATEKGILVCNSPSPENFTGLAEAVVGLVIALMKRLKPNESRVRSGGWKSEQEFGDLIEGKVIGLVGVGRVGREVARRFQGWGVRLVGYDPYVEKDKMKEHGVEKVSLDELLRISDVVSLHVVGTTESTRMIGARQLGMMKPTAYLVNTSRGEVLDDVELARALQEERIAGAALDVFGEEPLSMESPLRAVDPARLILTPHVIGNSLAARDGGYRMAIESTLALFRGEPPRTVLNAEAIQRWKRKR
jgi:D-3-phosphoglycerate dehydrogenase